MSADAYFEYEATVAEVAPHRIVLELDQAHELEAAVRDRDQVVVLSRDAYLDLMSGDY